MRVAIPGGWFGRPLSAVLGRLPYPLLSRLARLGAWVWHWLVPIRRRVARDNVRRALGDTLSLPAQRVVVRKAFTQQALNVVDILRAPTITAARSEREVRREGFEHLEAALARGRGAVVVMAHLGSLDLIGFSQAIRGLPMSAVVREIRWGPAHAYLTWVRTRTGLRLIPPRRSAHACLRALRDNRVLGLVIDQHMPKHRGVVCEFFGRLASTSPAPVRLALAAAAPIHPGLIVRHGFGPQHTLRIEPELALEAPYGDPVLDAWHNTQRINHVLERWVRATPEQWLWMHRRWKVDEDPRGWEIPAPLQQHPSLRRAPS